MNQELYGSTKTKVAITKDIKKAAQELYSGIDVYDVLDFDLSFGMSWCQTNELKWLIKYKDLLNNEEINKYIKLYDKRLSELEEEIADIRRRIRNKS